MKEINLYDHIDFSLMLNFLQAELLHASPVSVGAVIMLDVPHSVIVEVKYAA